MFSLRMVWIYRKQHLFLLWRKVGHNGQNGELRGPGLKARTGPWVGLGVGAEMGAARELAVVKGGELIILKCGSD